MSFFSLGTSEIGYEIHAFFSGSLASMEAGQSDSDVALVVWGSLRKGGDSCDSEGKYNDGLFGFEG